MNPHRNRPLVALALAIAAGLAPIASAQSFSGRRSFDLSGGVHENSFLAFSCGTDSRDVSINRPTGCVSFPGGGPGADEAAHWERRDAPGLVGGATRSRVTILNHPCGAAGIALASLDNRVFASDLIFYRRVDPAQSGSAQATMNLEFRGRVSGVQGTACGTGYATMTLRAEVTTQFFQFNFASTRDLFGPNPGGSSGPLASYANDDSALAIQLPPATRSFNVPYIVGLELSIEARASTCGANGSTTFMDSHATLSLPSCGPVFTLPPGITCRSAQLNIVDNIWMGPTCCTTNCCIADFDDGSGLGFPDGGTGIEDLLYYLGRYDSGCGRADVDDGSGTGTPDGGVGIEDMLYYLARYDAGC